MAMTAEMNEKTRIGFWARRPEDKKTRRKAEEMKKKRWQQKLHQIRL